MQNQNTAQQAWIWNDKNIVDADEFENIMHINDDIMFNKIHHHDLHHDDEVTKETQTLKQSPSGVEKHTGTKNKHVANKKRKYQHKKSPDVTKAAAPVNHWVEAKRVLGSDYLPGPYDVICARGKRAYNHQGNKYFREHIKLYASKYSVLTTKLERTVLLSEIVEWINGKGSGFVKVDRDTGVWYEVSDLLAREKIGQQIRESLSKQYKSSFEKKKERRTLTNMQRSTTAYQLLVSDLTIRDAMTSFQEDVEEQTRKNQEVDEAVTYHRYCSSSMTKKKQEEDAEMLQLFTARNQQMLQLLKSRSHLVQEFHELNTC